MRAPLKRYRTLVADSGRWDQFAFREGDIIISAPVKCGTTWVQTICALLIFQRHILETTLDLISPWFDNVLRPLSEVASHLDGQRHRRFIKSHTPLDGLPLDKRATYICIGRDPRDAALSLDNHLANLNMDALLAALRNAGQSELLGERMAAARRFFCSSQREWFWNWVDSPRALGLCAFVHHLTTFWEARECPNVVLLHYNDLKKDLEGQMRGLAARLGVLVSEAAWPELVHAATFEEMRKRADDLVPNVTAGLWYDNAQFFNKGLNGQWRGLLDAEDTRRYKARIKQLAAPELAAWIHQ